MSEQAPSPLGSIPAGWYPDPVVPGQQRYWDGSAWTGAFVAAPPLAPRSEEIPPSTKAVAGLVLGIVSWVACPIIAAVAALVLARSSDREITASGRKIGGAGMNTATRIIAWMNIGISILVSLVIAALVGLGVLFATNVASGLDPAVNARTGLADGEYVIDPSTRINFDGECSYAGSTFTPDGAEVQYAAVYGAGPIQCPDLAEVTAIHIEVTDGMARIVKVE